MGPLLWVQASHVLSCVVDDERMHGSPRPTLAQKPVTRRCWAHQRLWRLLRQRRPPQGWGNWSERWLWPVVDRLCCVRLVAVRWPHSGRLCACVWAAANCLAPADSMSVSIAVLEAPLLPGSARQRGVSGMPLRNLQLLTWAQACAITFWGMPAEVRDWAKACAEAEALAPVPAVLATRGTASAMAPAALARELS